LALVATEGELDDERRTDLDERTAAVILRQWMPRGEQILDALDALTGRAERLSRTRRTQLAGRPGEDRRGKE
jgi:hypothetical protein